MSDPSQPATPTVVHGRVAVITLVQSGDFPTAWSSLHTLSHQLSENRRRFILVNDPIEDELMSRLAALPSTDVIAPGRNLGVAPGRNRLVSRALEWGAELIVAMDDDIFAPSDYLDRLTAQFQLPENRAGTPQFGIAAPILLDYHAIAPSIHRAEEIVAVEGGQVSSFRIEVSTEELRSVWRSLDPESRQKAVHHMGVRHWRRHYFSALGNQAKRLRAFFSTVVIDTEAGMSSEATELRRDSAAIDTAATSGNAAVSVDSAAGGVSAIPASTFRDLGLLEEAFAPFGYEDAEMGVRARRSGLPVVLLTSEILLHDLQSRHKEREPLIAAATRAKARALMLRRHGGSPAAAANAVYESFVLGWAEAAMYQNRAGGASAGALAYGAGLLSGLFRGLTVPLLEGGVDGPHASLVQVGPATTTFSSEDSNTSGVVPTSYSGRVPIRLELREVPVRNGLANRLAGRVGVSYRLDPSGSLQIHELSMEFPGLFKLALDAELSGILSGEEHPDSLLTNTRLHHLNFEMTDFGLVDRLEETHAWIAERPSDGRLLEMSKTWPGPVGVAIRRFLAPWSTRLRFTVQIRPNQPVSARDLMTLEGGSWHVRRRLGLKVRVTGIDVADEHRRSIERRTT